MEHHHARLIIASDSTPVLTKLPTDYLDTEIVTITEDVLSIGMVRRIIDTAYQTPGGATTRLIVVAVKSIAIEAQQALLKVLEEPPKTTRFLLILPDAGGLLPTVLSRLAAETADNASDVPADFAQFLHASVKDRLELIATTAKKKDDAQYERWLAGLIVYTRTAQLEVAIKEQLLMVMTYARFRGASKKMLWEEVALTLPVR
jgi:DNA polymerase III delta prime subunit